LFPPAKLSGGEPLRLLKCTKIVSHIPGSLLINNLAEQSCLLSFYEDGAFGAVLHKSASERKFLVLSSASLVKDANNPYKSVSATWKQEREYSIG
jgi:hypothetical protein